MVRYKCKADRADENAGYIKKVFEELESSTPDGMRYASFCLEDGVSFVHIASIEAEENPMMQVAAFKAFIENIKDRCEEPPVQTVLNEIGTYRLFG